MDIEDWRIVLKKLWIGIAVVICILSNVITFLYTKQMCENVKLEQSECEKYWQQRYEQYQAEIEALENTITLYEKHLNEMEIKEEDKEISDEDVVVQSYKDFLEGNRATDEGLMIEELLVPKGEPDKHWASKYTYYDVNNDEIPELHVWSAKYYCIFSYKNDEVHMWASMDPQTILLNNGDFLYVNEMAHDVNSYCYCKYDSEGNSIATIHFSYHDTNENEKYDSDDWYCYGNMEVTENEWKMLVGKYLEIGNDEIEWITIYEKTT